MSEVQVFHHSLWGRISRDDAVQTASSPSQASPVTAAVTASVAPVSAGEEPLPDADDGLEIALTAESRDNIQRAPVGTRFYCVADTEGTTHCAASRSRVALQDAERSALAGQSLEPIAPGYAGTGHQQVARAAGIAFDEQTARVGYVDGEGYGLSIEKLGECQRSYSFRSAFNRTCSPDGGREMPVALAERFERGIENAFPACHIDRTEPTTTS